MKTIVTTFALSLALCAAAGATAQTKSTAPAPAADSVLLSECTDGDYIVRRFIVRNQGDADYSIRYKINVATLSTALNGNSGELAELNRFVENVMNDSLMMVKSVDITGYASPDGPLKFNQTLAKNRAQNFKNYVDRKYGFSKKYDVHLNSEVDGWDAVRSAVAQSSITDRQAVLNAIDANRSAADTETALKKMNPAVWEYLAKNILPPLRRVELVITYRAGSIVEQRMLIRQPEPAPEPEPTVQMRNCEPCCYIADDSITGIIVEMPETEADLAAIYRSANRIDEAAAREARIADKLARKEARAAEKIARKAEKESRRAAKAEAKAAKKSYKNIERAL